MAPLLEMRGISKAFPGVRALEDVSLVVQAGEVHFLLGQNGAGKSTLIRILCGAHRADTGEILVDGAPVQLRSPADARRLGIAVIFQEFSLVPYLNVAQNIFLGREFPRPPARHRSTAGGCTPRPRACWRRSALDLDTRTLVHRARRRAAADGRDRQGALAERAHPGHGRADGGAVGSARSSGCSIAIRTLKADRRRHHLHLASAPGNLRRLAIAITVLRDGRKSRRDAAPTATRGRARAADGRTRGRAPPTGSGSATSRATSVLDVRRPQSAERRARGEPVGARRRNRRAGRSGRGRPHRARARHFRRRPRRQRRASACDGRPLQRRPRARRRGLALASFPKTAKRQGLALMRSVQDNLLLAGLRSCFRSGWYRPARAARAAQRS